MYKQKKREIVENRKLFKRTYGICVRNILTNNHNTAKGEIDGTKRICLMMTVKTERETIDCIREGIDSSDSSLLLLQQ